MYLAHISEDQVREQSILEHLNNTATRASDFASAFACSDWGYACGLLHDIGKYSASFQRRIRGGPITDHATAGAQELYKRKNPIAAYCTACHHSGLLDGGSLADVGGAASFYGRMKKPLDDYQAFAKEITIPECSPIPLKQLGEGGFSLAFFIRMLFSCLVDADYLDTEAFMQEENQRNNIRYDTMSMLLQRLESYIEPWIKNEDDGSVNGRRSSILKDCLKQGEGKQGVYQLTVPTGGGKTISSLAFALKQAVRHNMERIIYVIPYTSITEQNAQIFKEILGKENVLEHHCNVVYENEEELTRGQLAAENWELPVIVTTNVQFFESLFSNKSSQCRKLHNMSNSIIIFDEAQMLPVNYLKPCIQAISELVVNYRCTAVLCTATQPTLQPIFPEQIEISEICDRVEENYHFFKRTLVKQKGTLTEEALISEIGQQKQVLCIVNSRKRAQRIYEALQKEGIYHLSTFQYPKHRKKILQEIRERLKAGKVCCVIATSLVEAGVDLDFHTVYRELAGIDSVIQAAGRCNREGKYAKEECSTYVFSFEKSEDIHLPRELKQPIAIAKQIESIYEDISSLEAIEEYFNRLYHLKGEGLDSGQIVAQFEQGRRSFSFPFQSVAKQFQLIENSTKSIFITIEEEAKIIAEKLRCGVQNRQLLRECGQYCIQVYEKDFQALQGAGMLENLGIEIYVLRNIEKYTQEKGLLIDVSRGEAVIY